MEQLRYISARYIYQSKPSAKAIISRDRSVHRSAMSARDESDRASKEFRDRLRSARKRKKLTQEKLVGLADLSPITLSKLENGHSTPTFEAFVRLAYALDESPDTLIGWTPARPEGEEAAKENAIRRLAETCRDLPRHWIEELHRIAALAGGAVDLDNRSRESTITPRSKERRLSRK